MMAIGALDDTGNGVLSRKYSFEAEAVYESIRATFSPATIVIGNGLALSSTDVVLQVSTELCLDGFAKGKANWETQEDGVRLSDSLLGPIALIELTLVYLRAFRNGLPKKTGKTAICNRQPYKKKGSDSGCGVPYGPELQSGSDLASGRTKYKMKALAAKM
ncbi:hypothetical protein DM860_015735 [Cuscuta australis]|uniref:Uncharacterized protein n=1 Tax=Cuscuta australis TaxID=267555 RepID=A0A328DTV8_9ASTE|nr:hypothetical protein DM860_015735 [Cuscuta australis]